MIDRVKQEELRKRLVRIEGQIRGLQRMVDEPRLCVDILTQLAAAESALRKCSEVVVRHHFTGCLKETLDRGRTDEIHSRMDELLDIFNHYIR